MNTFPTWPKVPSKPLNQEAIPPPPPVAVPSVPSPHPPLELHSPCQQMRALRGNPRHAVPCKLWFRVPRCHTTRQANMGKLCHRLAHSMSVSIEVDF